MPALIDTHTFLWLTGETSRLSGNALAYIEDESNELLLSLASGWKIAIKVSLGKLKVVTPVNELLSAVTDAAAVGIIPIKLSHIVAVSRLPFFHKDPFDRLLAAQCLTEGLPIVSADNIFEEYGVRRIW
jgi:PIN domain nuclease of toxin-antitoxin system